MFAGHLQADLPEQIPEILTKTLDIVQ